MSQENVEIVRAMAEGFNSADRNDLGQWVDQFFDPEIEWHDVPTLPGAGVHFGRDAYLRHISGFREAWDTINIVIEAIHPVDERVVACVRYGGIGSQSGADVAGPASTGAVFDFRAGRILRTRQFVNYAKALKAVGLSEQDAHSGS
jgi:ketosteroid isomerase-like protein